MKGNIMINDYCENMNISNKCQNLINRERSCDGNFARRQMHPWVSAML